MKLYSMGYGGSRTALADLKAHIEAGAFVLDIRYSRRSGVPGMSGEALAKSLGVLNYGWCFDLGNMNHRDRQLPILIADAESGLELLGKWLERRPVVILCACKEPAGCHRSVVARLAQERWPELEVQHLHQGQRIK